MGVMTLKDFRSDLRKVIGGKGSGGDWIDRKINQAYEEVAGTIEFKSLYEFQTFVTVDGLAVYDLADDAIGVLAVVDQTNDRRMTRIELKDYYNKNPDSDAKGDPEEYARSGDCIYLWRTPGTSDDSFRILYIKRPAHLSSPSATTVLPPTWDTAIYLIAAHFALLDLASTEAEFIKAQAFFDRAMASMRSRKKDRDWDMQTQGRGLSVPRSWSDVRDQVTG